MQPTTVRLNRSRFSLIALLFALLLTRFAVADPADGDYQGWLFETGVFSDGGFTEEQCFSQIDLNFSADLNWTAALTDEVCWGRTTINTGRLLGNFPPFATLTEEPDQSTRPLVSAGGNLYEMYGQDFEGGVGQGEERFGAILSAPSNDNLLIFGGVDFEVDQFGEEYFRYVDVLAKSTTATQDARTRDDLAGTNWHLATYAHTLLETNGDIEFALSTIWTLSLQSLGVCTFSTSDVFPDFVGNGDIYRAIQLDNGVSFDDRSVFGGLDSRTLTNCTYTIDGDKYLSITATSTRAADPGNPVQITTRYVVSDDNRHLVLAPALVTEDSSRTLEIGYRAASELSSTAINNTYFFYLTLSEFGADGAGAQAAGFGSRDWQEQDLLGRGKVVFDSTTTVATPAGETGSWKACSMEAAISDVEHEFTGNAGDSNVTLNNFSTENGDVSFDECAFRLDSAGRLRVYLFESDGGDPEDDFEAILRGYVNDNGELFALTWNNVVTDPLNPGNVNKDLADVLFVLGMEYTGDPDADADGDGISNFEEFKIPLPVEWKTKGDSDGDGSSDIFWRNGSNGQNALWTMDGGTRLENLAVPTVADTKWTVVGRGDYNGDDTADILWRRVNPGQPDDGQMAIWLLQGGTLIGNLPLPTVLTTSGWNVVGNGDYNGDNEADILWRNSGNGQNALWQINAGLLTANLAVPTVSLGWDAVSDGDFDGDGNADILWRNTGSGAIALWRMDGNVRLGNEAVPTVSDPNWQIQGENDYNDDGTTDLLWRNVVSGDNALWLMNGPFLIANLSVPGVSNTVWEIVGDGDYDGNGYADILWRNSVSGQNAVWLMDINSLEENAGVPAVPVGDWAPLDIE